VVVGHAGVTVDNDMSGAPTSRPEYSDITAVRFWCEGCHDIYRLCIGQWKGNTKMWMELVGTRDEAE